MLAAILYSVPAEKMRLDELRRGDYLGIAAMAIGQPFTIVPVTTLALATLAPEDAANGPALFNVLRNLGGSVGTAILDTVVTRREQFHDFRIGERVTAYGPAVQGRLQDRPGSRQES